MVVRENTEDLYSVSSTKLFPASRELKITRTSLAPNRKVRLRDARLEGRPKITASPRQTNEVVRWSLSRCFCEVAGDYPVSRPTT